MLTAMSNIRLSPLYFQNRGMSLSARHNQASHEKNNSVELPPELLQKCTDFVNLGDLAKLATVQFSWKNTLYDSAAHSPETLWKLACALLDGTDGLMINIPQGFQCLQQLVRMDVDVVNHCPVYHPEQPCSRHDNSIAASAMRKMAALYFENDEYNCEDDSLLPQSNAIGLAWLECAFVVASDVDAAHEMALIYEYAKYGVETDPVAAARYFEKAATAGHIEAMAELALCYELGCGVQASDEQALDWYMKAAEAGHVTAKYSVGEIFEEARGVPKSDEEACLWYYKAAVEGDEDSRKALRRLEDIARIVCPGVRALLDG